MKRTSLGALAALALATSLPAQAAVKWHPGHYLMLDGYSSQSVHFNHINEIAKDTAIKGVMLRLWWYQLEPSKGSYNFSRIDAYLNKLKSLPTSKRLVIRVMDRKFGTTSTGIVPDYVRYGAGYNGGIAKMSHGYVARIWEQAVMDRLIALYKAMGVRYNGNTHFEGIATEETAMGFGSYKPASYSPSALGYQYRRLASAVRPVMPQTNLFLNTNWLGNLTVMGQLIQGAVDPKAAVGSSNLVPVMTKITDGQRVWIGQTGADYRGRLAIGNAVEPAELNYYTPRQVGDFAYKTLAVTHLFWSRNTWSGTSSSRWSTGILPYLRTNPPLRTACPWAYGSCIK